MERIVFGIIQAQRTRKFNAVEKNNIITIKMDDFKLAVFTEKIFEPLMMLKISKGTSYIFLSFAKFNGVSEYIK